MSGSAPLARQHELGHLVHPPKRAREVVVAEGATAFGALRALWTPQPRAVTVSLDGEPVVVLSGPALLATVTLGREGADGPALALRGQEGAVRWVAGRFSRARLGRVRTLRATVGARTWEVRQDGGTHLVSRDGVEVLRVSGGSVSWTDDAGPDDLAVGVGVVVTASPESWTTLTEKLMRTE